MKRHKQIKHDYSPNSFSVAIETRFTRQSRRFDQWSLFSASSCSPCVLSPSHPTLWIIEVLFSSSVLFHRVCRIMCFETNELYTHCTHVQYTHTIDSTYSKHPQCKTKPTPHTRTRSTQYTKFGSTRSSNVQLIFKIMQFTNKTQFHSYNLNTTQI